MPMPRRFIGTESPAAPSNSTRSPSRMTPLSGRSSPAMQRSVVVLPQPDGPSSVKNAPGSSANSASRMPPAMPSVVLA